MKTTIVVSSCLIAVVVSLAGGSRTVTPTPGVQSIGVVRLVDLLVALSETAKQGDEIRADQRKAKAELEALAKEIETDEHELTTLKPTSNDYLKQSEALTEKKAHYSAHRELLDRQIRLKQQLWTQKAYTQVMRATREVAVERGLSLVLVKDDPNNITEAEGIRALIATQKVLYCGGCPDITPEVQAKLSAAKP